MVAATVLAGLADLSAQPVEIALHDLDLARPRVDLDADAHFHVMFRPMVGFALVALAVAGLVGGFLFLALAAKLWLEGDYD